MRTADQIGEFEVHSTAELTGVAQAILEADVPLLLFQGDLGAGKTTLVKALCRELGSDDEVSSPTFALVNEYRDSQDNPMYHIDLYRLKDLDEALGIGIEEYISSGKRCFIEWPEIILDTLPGGSYLSVILESTGDTSRRITIFK